MTPKWLQSQNNLRNEDEPKNEDRLKNEDNLKMKWGTLTVLKKNNNDGIIHLGVGSYPRTSLNG